MTGYELICADIKNVLLHYVNNKEIKSHNDCLRCFGWYSQLSQDFGRIILFVLGSKYIGQRQFPCYDFGRIICILYWISIKIAWTWVIVASGRHSSVTKEQPSASPFRSIMPMCADRDVSSIFTIQILLHNCVTNTRFKILSEWFSRLVSSPDL